MAAKETRYVVISPVKDEGAYLERTLESMIRQTVQPYRWVIVDDGSRDQTAEILARYSRQYSWIQVLSLATNADRNPGSTVVRVFSAGFATIESLDFDFVVKLDADLELPADYFEELLHRFEDDPTLGIASGVYVEQHGDKWALIWMPDYHAAGATKMIRAKCFREIGGFIPERGWDTVDEIRAQTLGWKTRHFDELQFRHLKPEGAGIGRPRTDLMLGEIYYRTGGGLLFFGLKVVHRMFTHKPLVINGILMVFGYLRALFSRRPLLVTKAERRFYRRLLNGRIKAALGRLLPWSRPARQPWRFA